jgi:NAD(P)-dependent dehydrogenase (short-subunit alcohol dehydrogenase family)
MEIKDTTIIITGASGTIGRVVAVELAKIGCDLVCHYNDNAQQAQQIVSQAKKTVLML